MHYTQTTWFALNPYVKLFNNIRQVGHFYLPLKKDWIKRFFTFLSPFKNPCVFMESRFLSVMYRIKVLTIHTDTACFSAYL